MRAKSAGIHPQLCVQRGGRVRCRTVGRRSSRMLQWIKDRFIHREEDRISGLLRPGPIQSRYWRLHEKRNTAACIELTHTTLIMGTLKHMVWWLYSRFCMNSASENAPLRLSQSQRDQSSSSLWSPSSNHTLTCPWMRARQHLTVTHARRSHRYYNRYAKVII